MARTITFNELRALKDKLPDGTIHQIAKELGVEPETVRNYFGGYNFKNGKSVGIHIEPGPDGGIVVLDDTTIFDRALKILGLEDYPEPASVDMEADQGE
ncbi:DNA-binding protein [Limibacterium fermenti]|jgi:SOS-response transcriptional repressor LexA|uniref:DNA-binding protein n=1 Tax=Limibacterium fermenti TaxID=3229863 RepID=UPI000E9FB855|nr:DNA-binding protein [Porphyromonadaceae bacterium]HBK32002.1 DNA-binding protein [Porphyromonadaceae bacterium]HBX21953.1 DNA-binding protein [Porphyromonadaceae bacterium]HBX45937.1 DNA-binding protein [Porphyromonadaceae bacterium]HCM22434.1 DNA-binding protein [Porphyromonadaceae bacterium]